MQGVYPIPSIVSHRHRHLLAHYIHLDALHSLGNGHNRKFNSSTAQKKIENPKRTIYVNYLLAVDFRVAFPFA